MYKNGIKKTRIKSIETTFIYWSSIIGPKGCKKYVLKMVKKVINKVENGICLINVIFLKIPPTSA